MIGARVTCMDVLHTHTSACAGGCNVITTMNKRDHSNLGG